MNKQQIKAKWVQELRSDNNQQVKGTLKGQTEKNTGPGYCCLGVLEEKVLGNELPTEVLIKYDDGALGYKSEGDEAVYSKFRNDLLSQHIVTTLTTMNDEDGKTFAEIADWIEQKLWVDGEV